MAKLSVIICVYNTPEDLFNKCLTSIKNSALDDIELVIVDDGSTYDYSKITKQFSKSLYIKTDRQGVMKSRLLGIQKATSPYICFVDSDDFVSFDYFSALVTKIEECNADIVLNDWAFCSSSSKYYLKNDITISKNIVMKNDFILKSFFSQRGLWQSYFVVWNKIYKKELMLKVLDIIEKFEDYQTICFGEDILINYFAFKMAKFVTNIHIGHYFYCLHNFQTIAENGEELLKKHVNSFEKVFKIIKEDLENSNLFDDFENDFDAWRGYFFASKYIAAKTMKLDNYSNNLIEQCDELRKYIKKAKYCSSYTSHRLLPENIDQIERSLAKIFHSNKFLKIYAKCGRYTISQLVQIKNLFNKKFVFVKYKKSASIDIPKEKYSLKNIFFHCPLICKLAVRFVPRGSKIRQTLKSKM